MSFNHQPFTDREASDYRGRREREFPPSRTILGMAAFHACYLGGFVLALAVIALQILTDTSDVVKTAILVGALILMGAAKKLEWDDDETEHGRAELASELREASNADLAWIFEKGERFPEIRATVQRWIAEDRKIRERDIRAIRAYLFKIEPQVERNALLTKLAGAEANDIRAG